MIIKYSRKYVYLRWRVSTGDPEIFNIFTLGGVQEEGKKDGVGKRAEESPEVFDYPGFVYIYFNQLRESFNKIFWLLKFLDGKRTRT